MVDWVSDERNDGKRQILSVQFDRRNKLQDHIFLTWRKQRSAKTFDKIVMNARCEEENFQLQCFSQVLWQKHVNQFLNKCHTLTEGVATLSGERLKSGVSRVKSSDAIKSQRPSDGHRDKIASLSPSWLTVSFYRRFGEKERKKLNHS